MSTFKTKSTHNTLIMMIRKKINKLLQMLYEKNLISIYPNIKIVLRINKFTDVTT